MVLDMAEDPDVPFILVTPFLATGGLTLRVNGQEVNFSIYRSVKPNEEKVTFHLVESIGSHIVNTQLGLKPQVSWKGCLTSLNVDGLESIDEDNMHNPMLKRFGTRRAPFS